MQHGIDYWLGIDCGGTYLKAGLYTLGGQEVGIVRQTLSTLTPAPGHAERDMEQLWQQCQKAILQLLIESNTDGEQIKGIGISAQGKGLFLLDKNDQPLGHGILSSDRRALKLVEDWQRAGIPQQLYPITRQTLWTGHPVSLLRWIKQHQPDRYREIGCVMMSHDFLRWKLTSKKACEETNISESNLYNMQSGQYDPKLTALLGISEIDDCLPPIVGASDIAGKVSPDVAALTGLVAGTPVVGGLFDVVSTAICAGLQDEFSLNAVMGTWAVTTGITKGISNHPHHAYVYGRYVNTGQYIVHEASPTSSGNLEWVIGQLGNPSYEQMNREVADVVAQGGDVFFLPFLYGSNAGLEMKAGFYGIQAQHKRAHLLQAVFEGVVFSHMTHLKRMRERFTEIKTLRVTGGSTRSAVWMQMLADISGLTLELSEIEETGCFGAAIIAMVGSGGYPDVNTAQAAIHPQMRRILPDPERNQSYQQKYFKYQCLVEALQGFHSRIKESMA